MARSNKRVCSGSRLGPEKGGKRSRPGHRPLCYRKQTKKFNRTHGCKWVKSLGCRRKKGYWRKDRPNGGKSKKSKKSKKRVKKH